MGLRCLILLLLGLTAYARGETTSVLADVIQVSGIQLTVKFSNVDRSWPKGEGVCLFRNNKVVGCGHVTRSEPAGVGIKLTHGTKKFAQGEKVKLSVVPRFSTKTRVGKFNLAAGTSLVFPTDYYYYGFLHPQLAVSRLAVIGIKPFYFTSTSGTNQLSAFGGFGTLEVYFRDYFRGFFLMGGLGAYSIKATSGIFNETATSPAIQAALGWRILFPVRINLAATVGAQYLTKTQGTVLNFGLPKLSPQIEVSFGFVF